MSCGVNVLTSGSLPVQRRSDLLTYIIANSCVGDHTHVCSTTDFDNSSTVARAENFGTLMHGVIH